MAPTLKGIERSDDHANNNSFSVGRMVNVKARTWPGINKPGGIGKITKVHATGDSGGCLDVRYTLGGRETKIPIEYVALAPQYEKFHDFFDNKLRDRSNMLGRCKRCLSLRKDCNSCDLVEEELQTSGDIPTSYTNEKGPGPTKSRSGRTQVADDSSPYLSSDESVQNLIEQQTSSETRETMRPDLRSPSDKTVNVLLDQIIDQTCCERVQHSEQDASPSIMSQRWEHESTQLSPDVTSFTSATASPNTTPENRQLDDSVGTQDLSPYIWSTPDGHIYSPSATSPTTDSLQVQTDNRNVKHLLENIVDMTRGLSLLELPVFFQEHLERLRNGISDGRNQVADLKKKIQDGYTGLDFNHGCVSIYNTILFQLLRNCRVQCRIAIQKMNHLYRNEKANLSKAQRKELRKIAKDLELDRLSKEADNLMLESRQLYQKVIATNSTKDMRKSKTEETNPKSNCISKELGESAIKARQLYDSKIANSKNSRRKAILIQNDRLPRKSDDLLPVARQLCQKKSSSTHDQRLEKRAYVMNLELDPFSEEPDDLVLEARQQCRKDVSMNKGLHKELRIDTKNLELVAPSDLVLETKGSNQEKKVALNEGQSTEMKRTDLSDLELDHVSNKSDEILPQATLFSPKQETKSSEQSKEMRSDTRDLGFDILSEESDLLVGGTKQVHCRTKLREICDGCDSSEDEYDHNWVQCDACSKWRILPPTLDVNALPAKWYCELNIFDARRNSCQAAEQTPKEVARAKRKAERKLARGTRFKSLNNIRANTEERESVDASSGKEKPKRKVGRPPNERTKLPERILCNKRENDDESAITSPLAVCVERSIHDSLTIDSELGSHIMSESSKRLKHGAKRPRDEVDHFAVHLTISGKRPRGRPPKEQLGKKEGKSTGPENEEWVQCEKCEKWRRLPRDILADDLPNIWYCDMNTWDPSAACCKAEEEKTDAINAPITGYAKGKKLSYRNLIFGNGKKLHRPISERIRAAESLFSSHPFNHSHEHHPVVLYAGSSVYMATGSASKSEDEVDKERPSFFDVMNRTNHWKELWGSAKEILAKNTSGLCSATFSHKMVFNTLPEKLKTEMKDLIFYVMGSEETGSHEVLREIKQCVLKDVSPSWLELRALCTLESVLAGLLDLAKEGRVFAMESTGVSSLCAKPKFKRLEQHDSTISSALPEARQKISKCMKIAKPWKAGKVE